MDRGDESSRARSRDTPGTPLDLASDLATIHDRRHTMDVDEVTFHPRQSTEDIQREAKRARLRQIQTMKRGPRIRNWPELNRTKLDPPVYQMSEKLMRVSRLVSEAISEQLQRLDKLDIETKEDEKVLSEKTEEVMHPCDFQHVEESKPPCEGYATPNPETGAHCQSYHRNMSRLNCQKVFIVQTIPQWNIACLMSSSSY